MKIAPAWRIRGSSASGSATASSRCSGAMRFAIAQASSRSRTTITAPRLASEAAMIGRRGIAGRAARMAASTRSANAASGVSRIACAISSCSACEKRSIATQSGCAEASAITRISEGPATMSMPTRPKTRRLAAAT